jgi:hypothetical protein
MVVSEEEKQIKDFKDLSEKEKQIIYYKIIDAWETYQKNLQKEKFKGKR